MIVGRAGFQDVGLDEEAILRHILLTSGKAGQHFHPLAISATELQRTGFEKIAILDEDNAPVTQLLDRPATNGHWNGDVLSSEMGRDEDTGVPHPFRVRYRNMGGGGPGFRPEEGPHVRHLS